MKWIGLTGGLACGKSTVARLIRERGLPVIDADEIAHAVVAKGTVGLQKIFEEFGPGILNKNGELNRRELGKVVFGNSIQLSKLESIIHPLVQQEVSRQKKLLSNQGFRLAFYDVPLLFEKNMSGFDSTVVVACDPAQQVERLKVRDNLSDEEIKNRLAAQLPVAEKGKRADFVLQNITTIVELEKQIDELIAKLSSL